MVRPMEHEELLFRLRFSPHFWNDQGEPSIECLRPLVRSDERVRNILMSVVLETEYLSVPSRYCMDLLLDELPDSSQAHFLLRMHAYHFPSEDALGKSFARRIMQKRWPPTKRLRREVEQEFHESRVVVGKDLYSGFVFPLFKEWAAECPKYIPGILASSLLVYADVEEVVRVLQKNPDFPLSDYELGCHANEYAGRLAAGAGRPQLVPLIRAFRQDGISQLAPYEVRKHAPIESWSPEDFDFAQAIAADPNDPFHAWIRFQLVKSSDTCPLASAWVERELAAAPGDRLLHQNLALETRRPDAAMRSIQVLIEKHQDFTTALKAMYRLAWLGQPLAAEQAMPIILSAKGKAASGWEHLIPDVLKKGYPTHPETLRYLEEQKPPAPPVDFSRLDVEKLLELLATSNGWPGMRAILELGERFREDARVKELLFQKAAESSPSYLKSYALQEVALRYRDAPETLELLTRPTNNGWERELPRRLISHLFSARETFEQLCARLNLGELWDRHIRGAELALWHADHPEAFRVLASRPNVLVDRWPDDERTFAVLKQQLIDAVVVSDWESDFGVEPARLISRAFPDHPEAAELLQKYMRYRPSIFAEYLGLNLGNDDAMNWGLKLLHELRDDPAQARLGASGPRLLVLFFGPRKVLLEALRELQTSSPCPSLRKSIGDLLREYFPNRPAATMIST